MYKNKYRVIEYYQTLENLLNTIQICNEISIWNTETKELINVSRSSELDNEEWEEKIYPICNYIVESICINGNTIQIEVHE